MARSLMDNPYLGGYLSNIGLGLMAAAQPQPMNVNRYSMLQNTVQGANQQMMQQRLFDMQMKQAQQEQQERESRGAARATLMGGHDPSTGITWDAPRQGLMDADRMSLMAQAAPETLMKAQIESLYREPKDKGTFNFGNWLPSNSRNPVAARRHSGTGQVEVFTGQNWQPVSGQGSFIGQQAQGGLQDFIGGPSAPAQETPAEESPRISPPQGALATGPSGVGGNLVNNIVGWLGLPAPFENVERAVTGLRQLKDYTTISFAGIADRETNMVRQRIENLTPDIPFTPDERAKNQYEGIIDILENEIAKKRKIAHGAGAYASSEVSDARVKLDAYERLLGLYQNVVNKWETPEESGSVEGFEYRILD